MASVCAAAALASFRSPKNTGITEVQVSGGPGEEDILSGQGRGYLPELPEAKGKMHFVESAGESGIKG